MGYHVAVLQYSVNTPHPVPLYELAAAVVVVKQEAVEWNVNPNQLILCGFSAGGHVCALYGAYWNQPLLCDLFNRPADDFQVAASILGYPVTNYVEMEHAPDTAEIADYYRRAQLALFGDVPLTYDLLEAVSPTLLAEATIPPTFLWGTTQDKLVPILQSAGYIHALATHHVPFEAHIFESGPHGLVLADPATAVYEDQVNEEAAKWVDLVKPWLRKRFVPDWIKKEHV
jgi:acetyl esterase/lipase